MRRASPRHKGVYQRCRDECDPDDRCRDHAWSYDIEVAVAGKRRHVTKSGFESARAAAIARAEVARRHRAGELPADDRITVGEWLQRWHAGRVERGELSPSTARGYDDMIKLHLIPHIGHRRLAELRGMHLTEAYRTIVAERKAEIEAASAQNAERAARAVQLNERRQAKGRTRMVPAGRVGVPRPVGPTTVRRMHAVLSAAMKSAVRQGIIAANPCPNADLGQPSRIRITPPSPEAYGAFLDSISDHRLYPLFMFLGHSGLRRGEALALRWEELDLATGRLVVRRSRISVGWKVSERAPKTDAGTDRPVYLDQDTVAVLRALRKRQMEERLAFGPDYQTTDHVFVHEDGSPLHPASISKVFARLARKHGLGTQRLHALRHFRASALISTGAELSAVSKSMGHKNISVTSDIYGHLFDSAAASLAESARGFVPRARPTTA